jgi:hypothetical protein
MPPIRLKNVGELAGIAEREAWTVRVKKWEISVST